MNEKVAVMPETQLSLWMSDPIAAPSCLNWCVRVLSAELQLSEATLHQLVTTTNCSALPALQHLTVRLTYVQPVADNADPLDLSQFFLWLPRQLVSLHFDASAAVGFHRQCKSLSHESAQTLTDMSSLGRLHLYTECLHFEHGIVGNDRSVANINAASVLYELSICGFVQSPSQLIALLRLAPHLKSLHAELAFSVVAAIPAIAHLCPTILSITCSRLYPPLLSAKQLSEQLNDLYTSIRTWPLLDAWFLHLAKLHLSLGCYHSQELYILCRLLSNAPKLSDVLFDKWTRSLGIYALSMLPHVTHILSRDFAVIDRRFSPAPSISFWSIADQDRREFRTLQDNTPLDGRKTFANTLFRMLSPFVKLVVAELNRKYEAAIYCHKPWSNLLSKRLAISSGMVTKQHEQALRRFSS